MRTIGVITVGRSDYGIYRPVLRKIQSDPNLKLHLIAAGMHLLEKYGFTVRKIEEDGFEIGERVSFPLNNDSPEGIAGAMGAAVQAFSQSYTRLRPDILLVLGDRFEMHAAALAALPFKIPLAHIHGGELTTGAIDNALRHSITLLSHLHFVAAKVYQRRLLQLGEEEWRVHCTGAPALDAIATQPTLSLSELARKFDLPLKESPILVTYHPVTLEYEKTEWQMDQLLRALASVEGPVVFTGTNADTASSVVWKKIKSFISNRTATYIVSNFGSDSYFSMLKNSKLMVGNSSSGLIEAPSFGLPVVNIGTRQGGRVRAKNVIDVGYSTEEIVEGIKQGLSKTFRNTLRGLENPYYVAGRASEIIARHLRDIPLGDRLLIKQFRDVSGEHSDLFC